MKLRIVIAFVAFFLLTCLSTELSAQCAMCKAAAEEGAKDGNLQSASLNTGIAYLLVLPYYLWYRNYKKKKAEGTYIN